MSHPTIFDPAILRNTPVTRGRMLAILQAALDAVRPDLAVKAQLHRSGHLLAAGGQTIDLDAYRRIFVLGAGKAGAPMAQAVEAVLGDRISGGLVVVKDGPRRPHAARRPGRGRPSGAHALRARRRRACAVPGAAGTGR